MRMMKKYILSLLICLILSGSYVNVSPSLLQNPEFEWMVNIGDTMIYTYTAYYDLLDYDGNEDPTSMTTQLIDVDGNLFTVCMQKGLKVTVEIIELEDFAHLQLTFNEIKTSIDEFISIFDGYVVQKTVNNRTFWDSLSDQKIYSVTGLNLTTTRYLEGDNFVNKQQFDYTLEGTHRLIIRKSNWKTGWLTHLQNKYFNETHLIYGLEISTGSSGFFSNSALDRLFLPVMFLITLLSIIILRKRST